MDVTSKWFEKDHQQEKISNIRTLDLTKYNIESVGSQNTGPPIVPGIGLTAETNRQRISAETGINPLDLDPALDTANLLLVSTKKPRANFPSNIRLKALVVIVIAFSILIIIRTETSRLYLLFLILISIVIAAGSIYYMNDAVNKSSLLASEFILLLILYTFLSNGLNVSFAFEIFTSLGIFLLLIALLYQTQFYPLLIPIFLIILWIIYLWFRD